MLFDASAHGQLAGFRALCDPSSMLALFTAQVDDCRDILMAAKRVVLAVDTDGPGLALASELVRRCVHTWAVVATYSFLFLFYSY